MISKTLDSVVRGQADIREIYKDTLPLWFEGLNSSKINFNLAYYGRGCTLEDSSFNHLDANSKPAPCTNSKGGIPLIEIEQFIAEKSLVPELLSDIMMKQITWNHQWIGYDDAEMIVLKTAFADNLCF
jgi:chitinase